MISLDKDEKVLLEVRKHWFILFAETFFLVFLLALPFFAIFVLQIIDISSYASAGEGAFSLFMFAISTWILLLWITFFVLWTDYYLDILIITDRRVIDVEQRGLFSREVSMFSLSRIQDVTAEVSGVIPTLLDFGDLHIQTAGEGREFIAKSIPNPYKVKDFVYKRHMEIGR